ALVSVEMVEALGLEAGHARCYLNLRLGQTALARAHHGIDARGKQLGTQDAEARHAQANAVGANHAAASLAIGIFGDGVLGVETMQPAVGADRGALASITAVVEAFLFGPDGETGPRQAGTGSGWGQRLLARTKDRSRNRAAPQLFGSRGALAETDDEQRPP